MSATDFIISDILAARECANENYRFIDTIRFEREIVQICSDITDKIGVKYITCCLILPNGTKFIISNNPGKIAIPYHIHGLSRIDNAFSAKRFKNVSGLYIPSEMPNDRLGYLFDKLLIDDFGVDVPVAFIRDFQGYRLFASFSRDRNDKNSMFDQPKERDLSNFVIAFFDQLLLFYAQDKPQLKYSRFCQDAFFRRKFIRGEFEDVAIHFKERELQCLYWTRMGKTAEEISVILGLKKATVRGYLENIRENCCVGSIQEAIVLAIQQKFIS